jgi:hypothetical protein
LPFGENAKDQCSVADPGCLSRIPDPDFYPFRIPDQKQQQKRGVKKIEEKNMGQFSKNYRNFYPKICHQALKNMGLRSGIRDPRSGIKKKTYSGSRIRVHGQKGSRSRIRNTGSMLLSKTYLDRLPSWGRLTGGLVRFSTVRQRQWTAAAQLGQCQAATPCIKGT